VDHAVQQITNRVMIFLHERAVCRLIAGDCSSDEPGVLGAESSLRWLRASPFGGRGFGVLREDEVAFALVIEDRVEVMMFLVRK